MLKEKKIIKKSPTKRAKKEKAESKIGRIEKMGNVYRKFVSEDSFIIGNVVGDEFIPFK